STTKSQSAYNKSTKYIISGPINMFRHMTGNKASLTYYAVLGVPIKATQYEIELAYYELRNEPASQSFLVDRTLLETAYEKLSVTSNRRAYDAYLQSFITETSHKEERQIIAAIGGGEIVANGSVAVSAVIAVGIA
ncbi:MAG: hypothetical protein Q9204_009133, partial [Flavoplaca sp. TL-2023a]